MRQLPCIIFILHYLASKCEAQRCYNCTNVKGGSIASSALDITKSDCSTINGKDIDTRTCDNPDDYCVYIQAKYHNPVVQGPTQTIVGSQEYTLELRDCMNITKTVGKASCYKLKDLPGANNFADKIMARADKDSQFKDGQICICKGDLCDPNPCKGLPIPGVTECLEWLYFGIILAVAFIVIVSFCCSVTYCCSKEAPIRPINVVHVVPGGTHSPSRKLSVLADQPSYPEGRDPE